MNLRKRLQTLERGAVPRDGGRCEDCGFAAGDVVQGKVVFGDEPLDGPDVCPGCGRPLILRLEFDRPGDIDRR